MGSSRFRQGAWRDVVVGAALVVGSTAQSTAQFEEQRLGYWPDEGPSDSQCVVLGDFNGDGWTDAFLGRGIVFEYRAISALMLGDGSGGFRRAPAGSWPQVSQAAMSAAAADLDGDGDLDLVVGDAGSRTRLYRNDGRARFLDDTQASLPVVPTAVRSVALGDCDRDGDLDLLIGSDRVPVQLLKNDGQGRFVSWSAGLPSDKLRVTGVEWLDADGDGDLDVWISVGDGQDRLWVQDRSGRFRDETASRLPVDPRGTDDVAVADFDGDGDRDIVAAGVGEPLRCWLNDGQGRFAAAPTGAIPSGSFVCRALLPFDFDADGDEDLVVGAAGNPETTWWRNDGRARFTKMNHDVPSGLGGVSGLAAADLDHDGDRDVVVATHQGAFDRVVLNDGAGRFVGAWHEAVCGDVRGVRAATVGDWDGDGEPDLAVARFGMPPIVALQNGAGTFEFGFGRLPNTVLWATDVAAGDFDGDGALDLVFATWFQGAKLWMGDGTGGFREAATDRLPIHPDREQVVVPVDVDGDGDLDVVIGSDANAPSRLYRNDGRGRFVDSSFDLPRHQLPILAMVAVDVDADGDRDLVVATALHAPTELWENDGLGRYLSRPARIPVDTASHPAVVALDVDGDQDQDLVLGGASAPAVLWRNDGWGVFREAPKVDMPTRRVITAAMQADDLDGDGDDDIVVATSSGPDWHLRNDAGRFVEAGTVGSQPVSTIDLVLADLDRDADVDLVSFAPGLVRVFRNRRQDLVPTRLARIGRVFVLRAFARPVGGHDADGIVFAGLPTSRPLATPLGWLRLVPGLTVPLGVVQMPQSVGVGALGISIPTDRALIGQSFSIQSLLRVPGRRQDVLTNASRVEVRGQ